MLVESLVGSPTLFCASVEQERDPSGLVGKSPCMKDLLLLPHHANTLKIKPHSGRARQKQPSAVIYDPSIDSLFPMDYFKPFFHPD